MGEAMIQRRVREIIEKMGVANRTQTIAEAFRRGWIWEWIEPFGSLFDPNGNC